MRVRSRSGRIVVAAALAYFGAAGHASACPDCPVGKEARRAVLDRDFARNLSIAIAPFLIIAAVCARLEIGRRAAPGAESRRAASGAESRRAAPGAKKDDP